MLVRNVIRNETTKNSNCNHPITYLIKIKLFTQAEILQLVEIRLQQYNMHAQMNARGPLALIYTWRHHYFWAILREGLKLKRYETTSLQDACNPSWLIPVCISNTLGQGQVNRSFSFVYFALNWIAWNLDKWSLWFSILNCIWSFAKKIFLITL